MLRNLPASIQLLTLKAKRYRIRSVSSSADPETGTGRHRCHVSASAGFVVHTFLAEMDGDSDENADEESEEQGADGGLQDAILERCVFLLPRLQLRHLLQSLPSPTRVVTLLSETKAVSDWMLTSCYRMLTYCQRPMLARILIYCHMMFTYCHMMLTYCHRM